MNGVVPPKPPYSNDEATARVFAALRDAGVEIIKSGSVEWRGVMWALLNWDVQGVTREEAIRIARGAL